MERNAIAGTVNSRHSVMSRAFVSGQCITQHLVALLAKKGYGFETENELDVVNHIKENACYVSSHDSHESREPVKFMLPDGQEISLQSERSTATEIMFKVCSCNRLRNSYHCM